MYEKFQVEELYAIEFALGLFCGKVKDSRVKWFTFFLVFYYFIPS